MKSNVLNTRTAILIFATIFCINCTKPDAVSTQPPEELPDTTGQLSSLHPDTISNHLLFINAEKKQGSFPAGVSSAALKSNIRDTLHLTGFLGPIRFLHEDTTKNISGAFIQVHTTGASSFYFDVPEVPDVVENDTVSVILVGIDPEGIVDMIGVPPAGPGGFEITIIPHDPNGIPIDEATVPVKIHVPPTESNPACGIVTLPGDYWDWQSTYTTGVNDEITFFNNPDKFWGLRGQEIRGCCTNGVSDYTANCDSANFRFLNFQTFFNWPSEIY